LFGNGSIAACAEAGRESDNSSGEASFSAAKSTVEAAPGGATICVTS
jgi:hypothetical protein